MFGKKKKEPLFDSGPEAFNLLMKEAIVKEFLDERDLIVIFTIAISFNGRQRHQRPCSKNDKKNKHRKSPFRDE
jgi:hypothetical protein